MANFILKSEVLIKILFLLFMVVLFSPGTSKGASYTHEYIDEKVRKGELPGFCSYAGTGRKDKTLIGRRYLEKYGQDWIHMHHYCWALADAQNGNDKHAIGNLNYVLRGISSDSDLRPMVLMQKATLLVVNQRYAEAVPEYQAIIKHAPFSDFGYVGLANVFLQLGDIETAREIVQLGLKNIPDSEGLNRLLEKIE